MSTSTKWIIGIAVVVLFFFGIFSLVMLSWLFSKPYDDSLSTSGQKVAVVELNDIIYSSEDIVRQFKKYRENRSVKAIVFRVNSPGGGVAASQEIFEEVKKTRDSNTPVVVSMGEVAASGGYYVSIGADRIVANPGTLTGSIGVIIQYLEVDELMKKIGIEAQTFKSGRLKDIGSPFRKSTEDERKFFDQLIQNVYEQFVDDVIAERELDRNIVLRYADGRVFTGAQALEYGFVDTLGTFEDAIAIAAEMGGIDGEPKVIKEYRTQTFFERLMGEDLSEIASLKKEVLNQPIIQYRLHIPF
ncbi:MAG: signal peptide peptidase SppA [Ignavibacteriae bacterium]|nr:signal peptide peptidase SppA [Ignavibacteriota bacterium]